MVFKILSGIVIYFISIFILKYLNSYVFNKLKLKFEKKSLFIYEKIFFYSGMIILFFASSKFVGLNLNEIFATAGVITIGIGFAAKTSISNLISGIILLVTKTIQVQDLIEVNHFIGIVENIDFFSTKLRTFDNVYITIPNEKLISEFVSNYSKYSIRRITLDISIKYEDFSEELIDNLKSILILISDVLKDPEPVVFIDNKPEIGVTLGIRVWSESQSFISVKNKVCSKTILFLNKNNIHFASNRVSINNDTNKIVN